MDQITLDPSARLSLIESRPPPQNRQEAPWSDPLWPAVPTVAASELPAVGRGELWLLSLPLPGQAALAFAHSALTTANVIIFDRALAHVAAALLPLGGYAEPAGGDGMDRSIQFARDGWSVVRLVAAGSPGSRLAERARAAVARLRASGAPAALNVTRFAATDSDQLSRVDLRLGSIDGLVDEIDDSRPQAVVFENFACRCTAALSVSVANGLAG